MRIAIIGTGISGVTLALRLQQLGVETTLFAERTPAEQRVGRPENFVARFDATRDRERLLDVAHWDMDESLSRGIDVAVAGTPIRFHGRLQGAAQAVDFREYLSRLVEDYAARGGSLRTGPLPQTTPELAERTGGHDVVVVAAGRAAPVGAELFAVCRDRSPYTTPQRRLLGGLCTGIAPADPPVVSFNVVPGGGEIFSQRLLTGSGLVTAFLIEAVIGGPLEPATHLDPTDRGAAAAIAELFEEHAPALAPRVDAARFSVLGPRDWLAGAITPTVRRAWAVLPDGRLALAIGDAWIVNDPVLGQGANIGSHCAWVAAHALAMGPTPDADFGRRLEDEMWAFAGPVTVLTNAFLQPPAPHVVELLTAASEHQPVADAFASGFADPVRLARALADPDATRTFIDHAAQPVAA